MRARLQVRRTRYRGREGWGVYGRDSHDRRVQVFVETREAAERVRARVLAGEETSLDDMTPRPGETRARDET